MRYYPRLKVYKNSSGTNKFDGHLGKSYGWTYGVVLLDGTLVYVDRAPSVPTSKHIRDFRHLVGAETELPLQSCHGLSKISVNSGSIRAEILAKIADLEQQLLNKRNRAIQRRKDKIAYYQKQLETLDLLEADYKAREAKGT